MIKFKYRYRKIDNNTGKYKIYIIDTQNKHDIYMMKDITGRPLEIPKSPLFGFPNAEKTAKEVCKQLESITKSKNPHQWTQEILNKVKQLTRLINRIHIYGDTYPMPLENLEAILGWKLTAWAIQEIYKKQIALYKLEMKQISQQPDIFINTKQLEKEETLLSIRKWTIEPIDYLYNSEKGEYYINPYTTKITRKLT